MFFYLTYKIGDLWQWNNVWNVLVGKKNNYKMLNISISSQWISKKFFLLAYWNLWTFVQQFHVEFENKKKILQTFLVFKGGGEGTAGAVFATRHR